MHASVSSCLFIRLIVDSLKQRSAVSWGVSLHAPPATPPLPNLSLFAVFSDLSISPFIFLQSSPHSSTSQLYIAWFLCPLISLHACVLLFLCLPRLVSQSVPGGTVKTWMLLDIAGATFPAACVLHSALWHQTGHDPWPSTYDKWGCLSHARWCRWRWYWGDVGHSGISTAWHFVLTMES